MQHDRAFVQREINLTMCLKWMRALESIRYIGFPTVINVNHMSVLKTRYNLDFLLDHCTIHESSAEGGNVRECRRKESEASLSLIPLVFWYDSNHLAHVQRYLQIYTPYKSLTGELREYLGLRKIRDMLLRNGDFIEDRFGQIERNCLTEAIEDKSMIIKLFNWFRSYLLWR